MSLSPVTPLIARPVTDPHTDGLPVISCATLPLLQPPLTTLPCFERPDPARHLHQFVRHGVAGCNSGRRPGPLHQQLLAVLQYRYTAFELPELIPHGSEALN
jgi:hypothetical protein